MSHLGWLAPLPLDAVADRVRAGNERLVAAAPNFEQERAIEWFVEAVSKVDGRSAISHHREPTHVDTGHLQLGRRH